MCGCKCHASLGLVATDLQSMLTPLMDSLRSELQQMILTTLDEVVRPLKEEASVIKLWLARVANHLEHIEIPSKDSWPLFSDSALTEPVNSCFSCSSLYAF